MNIIVVMKGIAHFSTQVMLALLMDLMTCWLGPAPGLLLMVPPMRFTGHGRLEIILHV